MAAARVFALPELLENILLQVDDPLDLFILQRVNSAFKDTITRNKTFRQRMFLEPNEHDENHEELLELLETDTIKHILHPFSVNVFGCGCDDCKAAVDVQVSCGWVYENRHKKLTEILHESASARKQSSWRGIWIGKPMDPAKGWTSYLYTSLCYKSVRRLDIDGNLTLGELIDESQDALLDKWDSQWKKHCAEYTEQGHYSNSSEEDDENDEDYEDDENHEDDEDE